ncbi:hypothetical protein SAMN05216238_101333 [Lentibacillus persicus]|uniref:SWIM-type domain-containing protein n=1 Tax=Lentibacillus persicus TaxID=640948 RepID=A0A1I1SB20_9BACI|nr:hypothetical protein [Lentibacillus persicus]SFD43705.1 hypothetical protein SAMN05216238_101333 [Lentibacillus persicus]
MFTPDRRNFIHEAVIEFDYDGKRIKGKMQPSKTKNRMVVDIMSVKEIEAANCSCPNTLMQHVCRHQCAEAVEGFKNTYLVREIPSERWQ